MEIKAELQNIKDVVSAELSGISTIEGELSETHTVEGSLSGAFFVSEKDYLKLDNKPQIEGIVLENNKSFKQLGLDVMSVQDIEKILYLE